MDNDAQGPATSVTTASHTPRGVPMTSTTSSGSALHTTARSHHKKASAVDFEHSRGRGLAIASLCVQETGAGSFACGISLFGMGSCG